MGRTFVIGDIHGDYSRLYCILASLNLVHSDTPHDIFSIKWTGGDTVVIQMGDQLDAKVRGESTWTPTCSDIDVIRFTERLRVLSRADGGDFVSIIGNHEMCNILGDFSYVHPMDLNATRRAVFNPSRGGIPDVLANRPIFYVHKGVIFTHAGIQERHIPFLSYLQGSWRNLCREGKRDPFFDILTDLLWNRDYPANPSSRESVNRVLAATGTKRMVVGHTPVDQITSLAEGKILLADVGISRAFGDSEIAKKDVLVFDEQMQPTKVVVTLITKK